MSKLQEFLTDIQQRGLKIHTVYDIGANRGYWSNEMKSSVLRDSSFYLFEANPDCRPDLDLTGLPYFIDVLSSPDRTSVKFFKANTTGDSYYKENTIHYDATESIEMPCRTLDSIVRAAELPVPNFIKADTQGSEIDILRGAESLLNQVDLVYLECPVIRYNLGAPNIQDYLDYMQNRGFIPMDLLEVHTSEQTLLQIDIMFIHKNTKEKIFGQNTYIHPLIV
jgi:FkbM family methyltransferase